MFRKTILGFCLLSSSLAFSQSATANPSHAVSHPANKDSAEFYLRKGLQEKEQRRHMASLNHFEKAAKFDPTNKTIVSELAASYYELRKYHLAWDTYKKLATMGDVSTHTYKQLVNLAFNLKMRDDVITYAHLLKKADPSEKINFFVGKVHYEQENYGDAIKYLNAASKEDPTNAEVPYMIARSYADMQNFKQSIPFFIKAIDLDTSKNHWVYELGLIYYAMHDDKNSLKYIEEAGKRGYRRDNEYLENLGIAHLNAGNLEQGVSILGEILKKRPTDLNILNMVAEAYYFKGKFQQAIDYWDKMLAVDMENASALYMIGMAYQKKGEKEKGQRLCDKAIEMDPSLASLKQKKSMMGL